MKTIKKIKKASTAVAGSALLVGATLAGGASMALAQDSGSSGNSYDLGSYPSQFVDEDGNVATSIVVGEDAKAADVVSAIDIGAQLGNDAFATSQESVEGTESTEVNGVNRESDIEASFKDTATATDYDELVRNYEYGEDDNRVTEEINVGTDVTVSGSSDLTTSVDEDGEIRTEIETGSVEYHANYGSGVEDGESLYILGTEYEVTSADSSELELGSTKTNRNLGTGDTVEHGPYSVEITDNDGSDTVYLTIKKDGDTLTQETFTPASSDDGDDQTETQEFGEDDEFQVSTPSVFFGNEERVTIETTYTDTTVENDAESPWDEDWDVSYSYQNSAVTSLSLTNNVAYNVKDLGDDEELEDKEALALSEGEALQGPNDEFTVENLGLTDEAMEDVSFGEETEVTYTDANGFEQTLDLQDDLVASGTTLEEGDEGHVIVNSDEGNVPVYYSVDNVQNSGDYEVEVTFEYGGYEETATFDNAGTASSTQSATASGYGFTMQVGDLGNDDKKITVNTVSGASSHTSLDTDLGATIQGDNDALSGSLYSVETTEDSSNDVDEAQVEVSEPSGDDTGVLTVQYEFAGESTDDAETLVDADLDSGEIYGVTSNNNVAATDWEDGSEDLSKYGTSVSLPSETSATLSVPENQRMAQTAIGAVTTSSSDGDSYTVREPTDPTDIGALDTDSDIESRMSSDKLVLVGGPQVNDLVEDLASDDLTWTADEYNDGEGLLQAISTDAYDALLVSGESWDDTRAAGEFLVNYEENSEDLEGSSLLRINTESQSVVEDGSSDSSDSSQ